MIKVHGEEIENELEKEMEANEVEIIIEGDEQEVDEEIEKYDETQMEKNGGKVKEDEQGISIEGKEHNEELVEHEKQENEEEKQRKQKNIDKEKKHYEQHDEDEESKEMQDKQVGESKENGKRKQDEVQWEDHKKQHKETQQIDEPKTNVEKEEQKKGQDGELVMNEGKKENQKPQKHHKEIDESQMMTERETIQSRHLVKENVDLIIETDLIDIGTEQKQYSIDDNIDELGPKNTEAKINKLYYKTELNQKKSFSPNSISTVITEFKETNEFVESIQYLHAVDGRDELKNELALQEEVQFNIHQDTFLESSTDSSSVDKKILDDYPERYKPKEDEEFSFSEVEKHEGNKETENLENSKGHIKEDQFNQTNSKIDELYLNDPQLQKKNEISTAEVIRNNDHFFLNKEQVSENEKINEPHLPRDIYDHQSKPITSDATPVIRKLENDDHASYENKAFETNDYLYNKKIFKHAVSESSLHLNANANFVSGLDDFQKFMENVDPPDELDVGAVGSSLQEVLMGQGTQIVFKRIRMGAKSVKKKIQNVIQKIKKDDEGKEKSPTKKVSHKKQNPNLIRAAQAVWKFIANSVDAEEDYNYVDDIIFDGNVEMQNFIKTKQRGYRDSSIIEVEERQNTLMK